MTGKTRFTKEKWREDSRWWLGYITKKPKFQDSKKPP
jgi:hypothetical protein